MKEKKKECPGERRARILILVLLAFLVPSMAMAASINLANWYPAENAGGLKNNSKTFSESYRKYYHGNYSDVTGNSINCLNPRYANTIIAAKNAKSTVTKGQSTTSKFTVKTNNGWEQQGFAGNVYKFRLDKNSKGGIVITYTGYKIWDDSRHDFVDVTVRAAAADWSTVKKQRTNGSKTEKEPLFAIGKTIQGLPEINIVNVKSLRMHYDFYEASTGKPYSVKTNLTYNDIDAGQAVSIKDIDGSYVTKNTNIKWKSDDAYQAFNAGRLTEQDSSAKENMFNFYFSGSSNDLIYTTNQVRKDSKGRRVQGEPNGTFSHFGTSVVSLAQVSLPAPEKTVSDTDHIKSDEKGGLHEGEESDVKENTIQGISRGFTYNIKQHIPSGMTKDSENAISSLRFIDTLDDCISLSGSTSKAVNVYIRRADTGEEVKIKNYTVVLSEQKVAVTITDPQSFGMLYGAGAGSDVTVKLSCRVKNDAGYKILKDHGHLLSNGLYRFSNKASRYYELEQGKNSSKRISETKETNSVYTKVPRYFHNLNIEKKITGAGAESSDVFTYDVDLAGLDKNTAYTIKSSNGSRGNPDSFTSTSTGTYTISGLKLSSEERVTIDKVPSGAKYSIREHGKNLYIPSFAVTEGSDLTGTDGKKAGAGEDLQSERETMSDENSSPVTYTFTNFKAGHKFILKKTAKIDNESTPPSDTFSFDVDFTGLEKDKEYEGSLFETSGSSSKTVEIRSDADGTAAVTVSMRSSGYFEVEKLPGGSFVKTEEKENFFIPSYEMYNGTSKKSEGTGKRNNGLSTPSRDASGAFAAAYDNDNDIRTNFTNKKSYHNVTVKKILSGGIAADKFSFTADLSNLDPGESYKMSGAKSGDITADEDGNASVSFMMGNEDSLSFAKVPEDAGINVTEKADSASDNSGRKYIPSFKYNDESKASKITAEEGKKTQALSTGNIKITDDKNITFTNVYPRQSMYLSKYFTSDTDEDATYDVCITNAGTAKDGKITARRPYMKLRAPADAGGESGEIVVSDRHDEPIEGIPILVKRADGKKQLYITDVSGKVSDAISFINGGGSGTGEITWAGEPAAVKSSSGSVSFGKDEDDADDNNNVFICGAEDVKTVDVSDDGTAVFQGLTIGQLGSLKIDALPEGATVTVTEHGKAEVTPSYRVTAGTGSVKNVFGSGAKGAELSTNDETIGEVPIAYLFTNDNTALDLTIKKTVQGGDHADLVREFKFKTILSGLEPGATYHLREIQQRSLRLTASGHDIKVIDKSSGEGVSGVEVTVNKLGGSESRTYMTGSDGTVPASWYDFVTSDSQTGTFTVKWVGGSLNISVS